MEFKLSKEAKAEFERRHRVERDGRVRDRIKVVLLKSEGWEDEAIAQALRVHVQTVGQHLQDWHLEQKLAPENGGSKSKLDAEQVKHLDRHLQQALYLKVIDIPIGTYESMSLELFKKHLPR
jgi:transposase